MRPLSAEQVHAGLKPEEMPGWRIRWEPLEKSLNRLCERTEKLIRAATVLKTEIRDFRLQRRKFRRNISLSRFSGE